MYVQLKDVGDGKYVLLTSTDNRQWSGGSLVTLDQAIEIRDKLSEEIDLIQKKNEQVKSPEIVKTIKKGDPSKIFTFYLQPNGCYFLKENNGLVPDGMSVCNLLHTILEVFKLEVVE